MLTDLLSHPETLKVARSSVCNPDGSRWSWSWLRYTNTTFSEAFFDANLTNSFWRLWGVLLASRRRLISRHQHLWNMDWEGIRFLICFGESMWIFTWHDSSTTCNLHCQQPFFSCQLYVPITDKDMSWPQRPSSTLMSNLKLGETQKMLK